MTRRNNVNSSRLIRTAINGRSVKPSADPTAIVTNPWNSITLVFEATENAALFVDDLQANLVETLGIAGTDTSYNIRVQSYRAWELSGKALEVRAFDLISASINRVINTAVDEAGRNHWAKLGFVWPKDHQNHVLLPAGGTGNDSPILTASTVPTGVSEILLHVQILWKTNAVRTTPTVRFVPRIHNDAEISVEDSEMEV